MHNAHALYSYRDSEHGGARERTLHEQVERREARLAPPETCEHRVARGDVLGREPFAQLARQHARREHVVDDGARARILLLLLSSALAPDALPRRHVGRECAPDARPRRGRGRGQLALPIHEHQVAVHAIAAAVARSVLRRWPPAAAAHAGGRSIPMLLLGGAERRRSIIAVLRLREQST